MRSAPALFVLVLTILSTGTALAQVNPAAQDVGLFQEVEVGAAPDAPLDRAILRQRLVRVDTDQLGFSEPASGASVTANLFDDVRYQAVRSSVRRSPATDSYVWTGSLAGVPLSQAIFVEKNGIVIGKITAPGEVYVIEYTGVDSIHRIRRIDPAQYSEGPDDSPIPPGKSGKMLFPPSMFMSEDADNGSVLDVMVPYSPEARTGAGGTVAIELTVELAIAETNLAYENADVSQRVALVHTYESESELATTSANLSALAGTSDGFMDGVHALRNEYHADFVALIVEVSGCGVAYLQATPQNANFEDAAFSVTTRSCAVGNLTFAHELGHNMGLRHDWYIDNNTTPSSAAHGFTNRADGWRTVMAYNDVCSDAGASCTRLAFFSNDSQTLGGDPMGVAIGTASNCIAGSLSPDPESCDADSQATLDENAVSNSRFRSSQITWIGSTSNWSDASNWEIIEGPLNRASDAASTTVNRLPRSIDDVLIPSSPAGGNFPSLAGNFSLRNMTIETGATLSISGGTLAVYGDWEEQGTGTTTALGGLIVFAGTPAQSLETSPTSVFNDLQIGDGGATEVTLAGDLNVNGNFTIQGLAGFAAGSNTLSVAGNWDDIGAGFEPDTGTVIFDGATQSVDKTSTKTLLDEDFNAYTSCGCTTGAPSGWLREQSTGFGFLFGAIGSADGSAILWDDSTEGWLFTPALTLKPGVAYELSFKHADYFDNGTFTIQAYFGSSQSSGAMTTLIGTASNPAGSAYQSNTFSFSVLDEGTYHIGFKGMKTATYGQLDDVVLTGSQGLTFHDLVVSSSNTLTFNADVSVASDVTVNAGGVLDLSATVVAVEGVVTNNGTIRETRTVAADTDFIMIPNQAADASRYFGLEINNPAGSMGETTVEIRGNQDCNLGGGPTNFVDRCFEIIPTTAQSADIRFWFSEAERNGVPANTAEALHWNGAAWEDSSSTASYSWSETSASCTSGSGIGCWIEADAVTSYSPFALGSLVISPDFDKAFSPDTIALGGTSTLTFVINNSGSLAASALDFTDSFPSNLVNANPANASTTCTGGSLTAAAGGTSIAYSGGTVGAGSSCTVSVTVTTGVAGSYDNTSGSLTSSLGNSGTASATLTVTNPQLSITKTFQGNADEDGSTTVSLDDTLTYSMVATNSGDVTLSGVSITDPLPGLSTLDCTPTQPATLAPTEAMTCSATYTITQSDMDNGSVLNTASADSDQTDPEQDSVTVNTEQAPALTLVKSTTTTSFAAVGDEIDYSYSVTNSGNVTLDEPVTITDDKTTATCALSGDGDLDVGETVICTAVNYVVTQNDIDAGSVTNIATASADGVTSPSDTVTVTVTVSAELIFKDSFETACPGEFPAEALCLELHYYEGLGYPEATQFLNVDYCPSTGDVVGIWFGGPESLEGSVFPTGPPETSIFTEGATFQFDSIDPASPEWNWVGAGVTNDTSGTFVGYWAGAVGSNYEEGTAPADYTFTVGSCVPD